MPNILIAIFGLSASAFYWVLIKKISTLIEEKKQISFFTISALTLTCIYILFFVLGFSELFIFASIVTLLLIPIFLTDALFYLIPDILSIPSIAIILIYQIYRKAPLTDLGLAALIAGGFFLLQYLVSSGRWIGSGDIRLGILMGLALGVRGTLVALFLAYIVGAIIALVFISLRKKELSSKIQFGTLLTSATYFSLLYGQQLSGYYLNLLGY